MNLKLLGAFVLLWSSLLFAQKGTVTQFSLTWNGVIRSYSVYVPPVIPTNPSLVMCLHSTIISAKSAPPTTLCQQWGWEWVADFNGFIVVAPISTWKPNGNSGSGWWFWQSYNTDSYFSVPPDDSGFLRAVLQTVIPGHNVNASRVFVTGSSSGGMMAHRVGIDSSDLVAAIAPISAIAWVNTPGLPNAKNPVSVLEYHGDADTVIHWCGGTFGQWGESVIPTPSVDADVNYWLAQDGMPPNRTPLCTNGVPTPGLFSLDFRSDDGVEVEFIRQIAEPHGYSTPETTAAWAFFAAHGRNGDRNGD